MDRRLTRFTKDYDSMYTMMAVVALTTGLATNNLSKSPTWLNDYSSAQQRVTDVGKPMAVFVGSGQDGWGKLVRDGGFDAAVNKQIGRASCRERVEDQVGEG